MRQAMVYFDSLSDEVRAALEEHRAQIQAAVNAQTRLKRTPEALLHGRPGRRRAARPSRRSCGASAMTTSSGLLLVDKPRGLTSHDVVARCAAC